MPRETAKFTCHECPIPLVIMGSPDVVSRVADVIGEHPHTTEGRVAVHALDREIPDYVDRTYVSPSAARPRTRKTTTSPAETPLPSESTPRLGDEAPTT